MANQKNLNSKRKPIKNADNFLEAFRDLGSDFTSTVSENVRKARKDISQSLFDNYKPDNGGRPDQGFPNYEEDKSDLERKYQERIRQLESNRREEKVLYSRKDQENKQQIVALQDEIKQLAKATGDLAREANISAMQVAPEEKGGAYHTSFFVQLISVLRSLRIQVQESSFWLASWNKKAQKKNYFWGQAKKSGSKYLLSSDRTVATQAG